jgi:lipopolysaccharide/colanic/teichoic acid biosynthesis glycosyltransferase
VNPRELLLSAGRATGAGGSTGAGLGAAAAPRAPALGPRAMAAKRALDVAVALPGLVVTAPLMLLIGIAVTVTSRGGPLFRQVRVGKDERPFVMLKFRTMRAGCDDRPHRDYVERLLRDDVPPVGAPGGLYKLGDDPRVTPLGRVLRRASLDELPQLVNVLRGEMSLVGPRPMLSWEAQLLTPRHRTRFRVPPGITGLWQVSGRSLMPMRDGLELDVHYVEECSLRLDLLILLRTVPVVLRWGRAR